jgi:hypothetical protein
MGEVFLPHPVYAELLAEGTRLFLYGFVPLRMDMSAIADVA